MSSWPGRGLGLRRGPDWYTCGMAQPRLTVTGTNIDAPDANALADFYRRLLGWTTGVEEPGWVVLRPPAGGQTLNFQTESRYVRPVWPARPDDGGPTVPRMCRDDDLAEAGRGLRLVEAYSLRWDYYPVGTRMVTWFECVAEPLA